MLIADELAYELATTPELHDKYDKAIEVKELPQAYFAHPAVREAAGSGDKVWPGAIFVDGVSFTRHDNMIGIRWYCVLSGVRSLLVSLMGV